LHEMPIYSEVYTVPAGEKKTFILDIEGHYITYVNLRFPPGPCGLVHVQFFYGFKQIFPHREESYFAGDNEIIEWQEFWRLPEYKSRLKIYAINNDTVHEHSFYVRLVTKIEREMLEVRLGTRLIQAIRRIFGLIE